MGELREINVGMIEDRRLPFPEANSNANPTPELIGAESWVVAEKETQRIISQFQANVVSEERRRNVIDYVQKLIRGSVGCEVFAYGSVPLKTYLPDGDIDLTAFGGTKGEDTLAEDIVSILEAEEKSMNADFVVKDVQLIRAEVKLVKCIVQNIVVDISFNQIGGLCTLCFLEQVDRLIGKDHLFKQSIILIKAWCYYESRILGAHHGLISTYALETLVLYIFHVFHSTLDGPLAVLYRFLDYFSKFDWETYCISLIGPVRISALPDLLAETPQNGSSDLLLRNDFLQYCSDMFSVPSRGADMHAISTGYAVLFSFGARKLGRILMHSVDGITDELRMFFSSTLDRHGSGQRPDVQDPLPRSAVSVYANLKSENCFGTAGDCKQNHDGSGASMEEGRIQNGQQRSSIGFMVLSEDENRDERRVLLGNRVIGDAKDLATSRLQGLKISNDSAQSSPPSDEEIVPSARMPPHAPHLYFSKSWLANGKTKNGDLDKTPSENFDIKESSARRDEVVASVGSQELNCSDLSGDYDSHFICLQYGRWCYEYALSVHSVAIPLPSPPPASFQGINFWDPIQNPSSQHFKRNGFSHGNVNGVIPSPVFYSINKMLVPPVVFGSEEMPKHRGTGTYFPNPNRPQHGFRPTIVKGRNFVQGRSPRTNGRSIVAEANTLDRSNIEQLPQSHFPADEGLGADQHQPYSPRRKLNPNANGFIPQPDAIAEFGSVEHHMPMRAPMPVSSRLPKNASLRPQSTSQGSPVHTIQSTKPVHDPNRLMVQKSYRLKDEDDFPPLSF